MLSEDKTPGFDLTSTAPFGGVVCSSNAPSASTGHTVVFADESGMNALGHVMLGTMDVHHQWLKVKNQILYIFYISGVILKVNTEVHCRVSIMSIRLNQIFKNRPGPV